MIRVLFDTNIALKRKPFYKDTERLFGKIDTGEILGFVSASNDVGVIITRNVADFKKSGVKIFTPGQFLTYLEHK